MVSRSAWHSHLLPLQVFLPHSQINAADESLIRCLHAVEWDDPAAFYGEAHVLMETLRSFARAQRLTWGNLF